MTLTGLHWSKALEKRQATPSFQMEGTAQDAKGKIQTESKTRLISERTKAALAIRKASGGIAAASRSGSQLR